MKLQILVFLYFDIKQNTNFMRKLTHEELLKERLTTDEAKKLQRNPVSVMLHNIRSLYNVGSMFRTADSALLSEIYLCGFTPHPPRKEIEKTALGAVETVPWMYFKHIEEAIEHSRAKGNKIFALELTDRKRPYYSLSKNDYPLTIIVGNELTGIDNNILELCDDSIEIPMYGVKHSLNVSIAAGISIFESIRIFQQYN